MYKLLRELQKCPSLGLLTSQACEYCWLAIALGSCFLWYVNYFITDELGSYFVWLLQRAVKLFKEVYFGLWQNDCWLWLQVCRILAFFEILFFYLGRESALHIFTSIRSLCEFWPKAESAIDWSLWLISRDVRRDCVFALVRLARNYSEKSY